MIPVKEILDFLNSANLPYAYIGDEDLSINSYASLEKTDRNKISWIKDETKIGAVYEKDISESLIVVGRFDTSSLVNGNLILCENPKQVFFTILDAFFNNKSKSAYTSPTSIVETTHIGRNVRIGHSCYIGPEVVIGDNVEIKHHVSIEGKVTIGKNTTINSGVVMGADGFGYFQDLEGTNVKVPHFGGIVIGEKVEIGANTCINRGTLDDTKIGNNVKINNLCHIGHNVIVEENVLLGALSSISGSVRVKRNVYIAPAVTILNQLSIGENSFIGAGSVVVKDVEDHVVVVGVPGKITKRLEVEH
ncbi:DapH/DapD/GlmU-related protein [Lysinibacillus sp. SGAir0095]|uniref:DapH/DapD/GlmU-related protein n=1 Tax=Lysinibacillus sp. SGAir0095 TaxID=2070463 RepID=UPI0010CCF662|nr:DapH/DapD/GlmU-related protein [Lysinibacillus sp. SGAir0095]QCR31982.1 hypothetical protein C1N55_07265 [Lysinibacillus sp. SGAir0095]